MKLFRAEMSAYPAVELEMPIPRGTSCRPPDSFGRTGTPKQLQTIGTSSAQPPLFKIKTPAGIDHANPRHPYARIRSEKPWAYRPRTQFSKFSPVHESARKIVAESCPDGDSAAGGGRGGLKKRLHRTGAYAVTGSCVFERSARVQARIAALRDHQVAHSSSPSDHISSPRTIADYYKQSSRRALSLRSNHAIPISLRPLPFICPSLSFCPGSAGFQPHRDPGTSRTYHCRSISISGRLAPTSQECDTARNSSELHISLDPAK